MTQTCMPQRKGKSNKSGRHGWSDGIDCGDWIKIAPIVASHKSKNFIKRVQCRLKLLKNKRSCIIRQLRDDLSELLRNGHYQIVIDRVEQLSLDERKVAVYDLLEIYCEFIIINFPYIRRHKDCPNDINEVVSSLIFASARLGDLPELVAIRKLFGERYGQIFEKSALQLLPGNLVIHQLRLFPDLKVLEYYKLLIF